LLLRLPWPCVFLAAAALCVLSRFWPYLPVLASFEGTGMGLDWALAKCVIGQRGKQTQTKPAGEETSQQNCQLSEKCALGNKTT